MTELVLFMVFRNITTKSTNVNKKKKIDAESEHLTGSEMNGRQNT